MQQYSNNHASRNALKRLEATNTETCWDSNRPQLTIIHRKTTQKQQISIEIWHKQLKEPASNIQIWTNRTARLWMFNQNGIESTRILPVFLQPDSVPPKRKPFNSQPFPMTDPWCCYIWCAMDPIIFFPSHVSIYTSTMDPSWVLKCQMAINWWLNWTWMQNMCDRHAEHRTIILPSIYP